MAGMKVTLSAAMRARDVSRPGDEDLAAAAAVESTVPARAPREAPQQHAVPAPPPGEHQPAGDRSPRQRQRRRQQGRLRAGERRQHP